MKKKIFGLILMTSFVLLLGVIAHYRLIGVKIEKNSVQTVTQYDDLYTYTDVVTGQKTFQTQNEFVAQESAELADVFDADYYYNRYPDVAAICGHDPNELTKHFLTYGMREGRQGSENFDVNSYKNRYKDLRQNFGYDLTRYYHHYINYGKAEGRTATGDSGALDGVTVCDGVDYSAVYDYQYYIANNPDVAAACPNDDIAVLNHFVRYGMNEGRTAKESFNVWAYRAQNKDLRTAYGTGLEKYYLHYIAYGQYENRGTTGSTVIADGVTVEGGVDYAPVYNYSYYTSNNPDVAAAFPNDDAGALHHFVSFGMTEGRQGSENFNVRVYQSWNPDVYAACGNNLKACYMHYVQCGMAEGRRASGEMQAIGAVSKKGLQGIAYLNDENLGEKHILMNIDLSQWMLYATPEQNATYFQYNGVDYYFNGYMGAIDEAVAQANARGITVTAVLLMPWSDEFQARILPSARQGGHRYYAINAAEPEQVEYWSALFTFLMQRYSRPECHIDNWILGNEINMPNDYNFTGSMDLNYNADMYAAGYLMLYNAMMAWNPGAKAYIPLDHSWTSNGSGFGGRYFLDAFVTYLNGRQGGVNWNLAYHLYSPNLSRADFWNQANLTPHDLNASYISAYNLTTLTDYVKNTYGAEHRISLSEEGFEAASGENVQAAAIAYTFYAAQFNDMVDSVIFRSYIDEDGDEGYHFGIAGRQAYNVFCNMDTANGTAYTDQYLQLFGSGSWSELIPGYSPFVNWQ